jgi:benzoyl-CoA reductase/2-hydroxyglutaryl-CoA dehydratase subunit BcrC/BadD/HgdB
MNGAPRLIGFDEWERRYDELVAAGMEEPSYGGPLSRHVADGDFRLRSILYDNSAASLRLWNFLLTEEDRLAAARAAGKKIVGTMKDLGTVPVMAYSSPDLVAFYPDGAWWIPCVMELSAGLLGIADSLGIDESYCPVRAMLGAFVSGNHFPLPDLITCSVGATCDDFSAIAQRLAGLGYPITWWEAPARRKPEEKEEAVTLPGNFVAPTEQVAFVKTELERLRGVIGTVAGKPIDDDALASGIKAANRVRRVLDELRNTVFHADPAPMPALEMLIAEMLAIHFCSDREETIVVLDALLAEARRRAAAGTGVLDAGAVRVFWVNPVADLCAMNLLEQCGGRVCGTEFLFAHALDAIPEDLPPMEALARMALADPMTGSAADRAARICADISRFDAEALLISRIPGASHCATEGEVISYAVREKFDVPIVEIEVPPVSNSMKASLSTRLEALVETVMQRRKR